MSIADVSPTTRMKDRSGDRIPTLVWGSIWISIAVVCSAVFLLLASKKKLGADELWSPGVE